MKPKTFDRKLKLNRQTIAHLEEREMRRANGGGTDLSCGCPYESNTWPGDKSFPDACCMPC